MRDHTKLTRSAGQFRSSAGITARHLSREFDLDDKWLRKLIRRRYRRKRGWRWVWTEDEAAEVRAYLRSVLNGGGK
jgi:hypothetical protein